MADKHDRHLKNLKKAKHDNTQKKKNGYQCSAKKVGGSLLVCCYTAFNQLPDGKILDWSKLKQSADDNFEFDVNSRKFSKLVENTVGKGEIARYEQFLLFPKCFQNACFPGASKCVIVGNGLSRVYFESV